MSLSKHEKEFSAASAKGVRKSNFTNWHPIFGVPSAAPQSRNPQRRHCYACGFAQSGRPNLPQIRAPILRSYSCALPKAQTIITLQRRNGQNGRRVSAGQFCQILLSERVHRPSNTYIIGFGKGGTSGSTYSHLASPTSLAGTGRGGLAQRATARTSRHTAYRAKIAGF
jgi:hypothetical protein